MNDPGCANPTETAYDDRCVTRMSQDPMCEPTEEAQDPACATQSTFDPFCTQQTLRPEDPACLTQTSYDPNCTTQVGSDPACVATQQPWDPQCPD